MKKIIYSISLALALLAVFSVESARAYVLPYYTGPSPEGLIEIDKKVKNPTNDSFTDNLGTNDYKFAPGEEVVFKVRVKNIAEIDFVKVKITDSLPDYLVLTEGELEKELENLKPDQAYEFEIKTKVVEADKLPSNQGIYCVVNRAKVIADDQENQDTAQLCLETKVLGASTQPEAGTNPLVLAGVFTTLASVGFFLKKRA